MRDSCHGHNEILMLPACKHRADAFGCLQFFWSAALPEGPSGFVLTTSGQLLEGRLVGQLAPWHKDAAGKGNSCAALSPDGRLLALTAGDNVTVHAMHSQGSFSAAVATQVGLTGC